MGLSLEDSVEDEDEMFEVAGITFIIERSLRERLGEVVIEYTPDAGVVVKGSSQGTCGAS